jgi:hypothetical protein
VDGCIRDGIILTTVIKYMQEDAKIQNYQCDKPTTGHTFHSHQSLVSKKTLT